jgi:hypothetical protein
MSVYEQIKQAAKKASKFEVAGGTTISIKVSKKTFLEVLDQLEAGQYLTEDYRWYALLDGKVLMITI